LATPQNETQKKNTITMAICLILLAFFLFLLPVNAESTEHRNTNFETKLIFKQSTNQATNAVRKYRDGLLNENQGQLFFNLDQVNILNSNDDKLKINFIFVDKNDFYLATNLGIFQNYRQIFSKENCSHIEKSSRKIFIACENGIYQAEFDAKDKFKEFSWEVLASSPRQVSFFNLNKSKSNPKYAVSKLGFHIYNPHKKSWELSNYGLTRNFEEEFKLGRYLVTEDTEGNEEIFLGSAVGVMNSKDSGKTWSKDSSGIASDPDGFYTIREIIKFQEQILVTTSTGLYSRRVDSKNSWNQLILKGSKKDSYANQNIYSIDSDGTEIFIGNSQGEIFHLSEKQQQTVIEEGDYNPNIISILKIEPKIQEVHLAALNFSGIPTGDSFKRYRKHARMRNFLPELQTYVEKNNLNYISIETRGSDNLSTNSGAYDTSFDRNNINRNNNTINAGLRLNWKLGNLIFDPEINDINTSARITANVRENILTEVTQLYFRRKELLVKALKGDTQDLSTKLELDELLAQLDARTGAWYSEELKKNLNENLLDIRIKEFYYDS